MKNCGLMLNAIVAAAEDVYRNAADLQDHIDHSTGKEWADLAELRVCIYESKVMLEHDDADDWKNPWR